MKFSEKQADSLAKAWMTGPSPMDRYDWPSLRDYVDLCTASDLDAIQLDILTDMVWNRLPASSEIKETGK